MALMPETTSGSPPATRCLSSCDQPTMALSGVRSSCDSVARKSSLSLVGALGLGPRRRLAGQQPLPLGLDLAALGDVGGDGEADARAGVRSRRSTRARRAGRRRAAPAACRATRRWRPAPRAISSTRCSEPPALNAEMCLPTIVGAVAPERRAHRRVHLEEDQVVAEQGDAVQRLLEHRLELRLALAQRVLGAAGAEERVDGGDEHRRLDRMREVAVGAGVEALHLVDVVDEGRGEVDDRRARRLRRGAQAAADLEAVDVGQVDVEHDQVERLGGQRAARRCPVRGLEHREARRAQDAAWSSSASPGCRRRPGSTAAARVAIVVIRSPPGRRVVAAPPSAHGQLQRDRDREPRALAELALDRDVAAEQRRQLAAERQTEAGAAQPLLDRRVDLDEVLEQRADVLGGDADAGVGDRRRSRGRRRPAWPRRAPRRRA